MSTEAFAEYLSGLDKPVLVALFKARPDVLSKPVPRGFSQLAERLSTPGSLGAALRMVNRDVVTVGQLVAVLGPAATKSAITRLVRAPERLVHDALSELCGRGLAWERSGTLYLPERLQAFWSEHVGDRRPVVKVGHRLLFDCLGLGFRSGEPEQHVVGVAHVSQSAVAEISAVDAGQARLPMTSPAGRAGEDVRVQPVRARAAQDRTRVMAVTDTARFLRPQARSFSSTVAPSGVSTCRMALSCRWLVMKPASRSTVA